MVQLFMHASSKLVSLAKPSAKKYGCSSHLPLVSHCMCVCVYKGTHTCQVFRLLIVLMEGTKVIAFLSTCRRPLHSMDRTVYGTKRI